MKYFFLLLLLVSSVSYAECPQKCVEYAIHKISECSQSARREAGEDDKKFIKVWVECLNKLHKDPEYMKCKKICQK
jgi:hypothetical protein